MLAEYGKKRIKSEMFTPERWQSKMHLTVDEGGSKITRNSVFDCHLSPVRGHMAIKHSVSSNF